MKKILLAVALLLSPLAEASNAKNYELFNQYQHNNLQYAYAYGEQYDKQGNEKTNTNRYDNKGLGYIFAAIAWKESSAGVDLTPKRDHHAYGMFQNYLKTIKAKRMQRGQKPLTDRQLIAMIMPREASAYHAMDELRYWLKVRNGNVRLALASYNAGWNYSKGLGYADNVLSKANYLKSKRALEIKRD